MFATRKGRFGALFCLVLAFATVAAHAQPKQARIGVLCIQTGAAMAPFLDALRAGLRERGLVDGKNIIFDARYADGKLETLRLLASELAAQKVDVIVTDSGAATVAARRATQTIPIVVATVGVDPVQLGLAQSLARPGGNVTGVLVLASELSGKRLQILREIAPATKVLAAIYNEASPNAPQFVAESRAAAAALGIELRLMAVRRPGDLDAAFKQVLEARPDAFITLGDAMLLANRSRITAFASQHRLPGVFPVSEFADAGGLASYGPSAVANYWRAAGSVERILKGAKAGEIPFESPAKLELVVNLKTAKEFNLNIPAELLSRADRLIR